ncbi:VWA domain-containing protein [Gemmata sp. JC673]|uniref:VWA domain-containing protein n=1 Tax=Gemmata algarum TaxID=2975278 RepID=A0ABU5EXA2_9BACT|nr:VWA domain-containing protein [Gemmata algarum]MDY3559568.1 VWA domain-containing protein [Gemmata algarum]
MVAEVAAGALLALALIAELIHARRVRRAAVLAFGPAGRPAPWTRITPVIRAASAGAFVWGLTTLLLLPPKVHDRTEQSPKTEARDIILVLDVSPSMRLQDAGPGGSVSRSARSAELMKSFYSRIQSSQFRTSVVACYTGARPVVERTTDPEVVRNILTDLPMHFAFRAGPTDLLSGIEEAARMATPWRAGTATLVVVSDGDTIAATGMPPLPPAVSRVLVIGVGDTANGKFIDGHNSRQDVSSLRQLATRLGGEYHDGNVQHVSTDLLQQSMRSDDKGRSETDGPTRREAALAAVATGALVLALLPVLLHTAGTSWRPGTRLPQQPAGARPIRAPATR